MARELPRSLKELLFRGAIKKSGGRRGGATRPTITLDRVRQVNTTRAAERHLSVFEQAASQLAGAPTEAFLATFRLWKVKFGGRDRRRGRWVQ